jgi:acyl dehydratase
MMYFEEVVVGERYAIGSHTFTAEEIKRFASAFDPQPFHLDEAAAERSHFKRLLASGWHTMAVWMRLNVREMQRQKLARDAEGKPVARAGPSPGFEQLKWLKPVYVGDTVSFETEIVATRPSRSRPGWGVVSFRNLGRNQHGEEVVSFIGHVFMERRSLSDAEMAERVGA